MRPYVPIGLLGLQANDLDVFGYLNFLLTELPKLGEAPTDEQLACVLPWGEALPDYCRNQSKK